MLSHQNTAAAERRVAERAPGPLDGFTTGQRSIRIGVLSVTGCFVETKEVAVVGQHVELKIQIPNWGLLDLEGEVAYTSSPIGFAVWFINLRPDTEIVLQAAVDALLNMGP